MLLISNLVFNVVTFHAVGLIECGVGIECYIKFCSHVADQICHCSMMQMFPWNSATEHLIIANT